MLKFAQSPPSVIVQDIKTRASLIALASDIEAESSTTNKTDTESRYYLEVKKPETIANIVQVVLPTVQKFNPEAEIQAAVHPEAPNKLTVVIKGSGKTAAVKTAAEAIPLESAPIAAQINDAVYGISTNGKEFYVMKDGDKATTAESLAEAFALWVGLLKQDLFLAVKGTDGFDRLEADRGFLDGLIPVLLDSPTVSDKAAKALTSFYEMATLKKLPEDGAE